MKAQGMHDEATLLTFKAFQAALSSRAHVERSTEVMCNLVKERNSLFQKNQELGKSLEKEREVIATQSAQIAEFSGLLSEKDERILLCAAYYGWLAQVEMT